MVRSWVRTGRQLQCPRKLVRNTRRSNSLSQASITEVNRRQTIRGRSRTNEANRRTAISVIGTSQYRSVHLRISCRASRVIVAIIIVHVKPVIGKS
uniref:Uncharacterized protein n=1 Tax=Anopheles epiroticus TaxID=199890 RepID=A0A182PCS2_9DIPT